MPGTRAAGRSTLTQQLARHLFPQSVGFERTWERKIKEAIVAIKSRSASRNRRSLPSTAIRCISGMAYGVEAASRLYFGKPAKALTLEEAALIAGNPAGQRAASPYVNMAAALRRRNYALDRMAAAGFIPSITEAAKQKPIEVRGEPNQTPSVDAAFSRKSGKHLEALRVEAAMRTRADRPDVAGSAASARGESCNRGGPAAPRQTARVPVRQAAQPRRRDPARETSRGAMGSADR